MLQQMFISYTFIALRLSQGWLERRVWNKYTEKKFYKSFSSINLNCLCYYVNPFMTDQWTGFYIIMACVMKGLNSDLWYIPVRQITLTWALLKLLLCILNWVHAFKYYCKRTELISHNKQYFSWLIGYYM